MHHGRQNNGHGNQDDGDRFEEHPQNKHQSHQDQHKTDGTHIHGHQRFNNLLRNAHFGDDVSKHRGPCQDHEQHRRQTTRLFGGLPDISPTNAAIHHHGNEQRQPDAGGGRLGGGENP